VDLPGPSVETLLVAGDLVLVPTQEPDPSAQRAALHALGLADGTPRWQRSFEYVILSGLITPPTPSLILLSLTSTDLLRGEGALVALDAAGEERWRWAPGVQRVSAPASVRRLVRRYDFSRSEEEATETTATNAVCFTADAHTLVVIDPGTGEERARIPLEESASLSAPAVVDDVVYVPCRGPHLLAVDLEDGARWHFVAKDDSDAWLDKTPVVVGERIFTVLTTGAVLALRAEDGSLAWRADVGPAGKPLGAPATDGERLFVGARDGLHVLDLADGRQAWAVPTERRITASPVVAGGVVYAPCHDHRLYALGGP